MEESGQESLRAQWLEAPKMVTKWLLNATQKARQASAKHTPSTRQAYAKQRPFRAKHTRGHPILCDKTTKTAAKQRPQVPLV